LLIREIPNFGKGGFGYLIRFPVEKRMASGAFANIHEMN
jgi:hypothetical protein